MAAPGYADPRALFGTSLPKVWKAERSRSYYGDVVLVLFLLAQCLDGVFTYVGVSIYGLGIEANPLLAGLMTSMGYGTALVMAKIVAATLGICLHLRRVHGAVALLAAFYGAVAILPWTMILFA